MRLIARAALSATVALFALVLALPANAMLASNDDETPEDPCANGHRGPFDDTTRNGITMRKCRTCQRSTMG
jgi:hypothetical protein